ncbi:ATP-binding cassette subfamily B protein [Anaeroplasma bactoclasticum]|jgi:ATP-binding cassette subfamily B protein|uniref:ATP-binding cassette subfamily B protein n=1 Tax=Anaeroplasma bactoclasticum TaxID=2088 RepID=A0A397RVA3_9MOLU|nr:ABC transporter ATP-binding protein [Anaeroplasma bactoclasticum]RIA78123.1 ATP-binding cassette subfamily B protein [Anaeroplasma bactoclasticum]
MLKRFISYYKPYKGMFTLDMLASLFIAIIGMAYPILTNIILRNVVPDEQMEETRKITLICILASILIACYFIRMGLRFFVQYYGHVIGVKMQADMRRELFTKLEKLPFSYYDEHETGKIMSRMTNDLMDISELAHHGPENFFICGISIILSLGYLFYLNWVFALIILGCVPLLIVITLIYRKKMRDAFMATRKSVAEINGALESSISGVRVTKAFTNSEKELEKFEIGNKSFVKSRSIAYKAMGAYSSTTTFVTDLFNVALLAGGGILVALGKLEISIYVTFVVSVSLFITPLTTLINFVEQYQNGVTGFKRFVEIIDEKEEETDPNSITVSKLKGEIEFHDVSFGYHNKDYDIEENEYQQERKEVLSHVSFKLDEGKTIALVGPSGGGKTTICHLIPNFYKCSDGYITIDGKRINQITFDSLRRNIGIVQQDVFLFNGSIKDNILYGRLDATMEEVIDAAKRANIHDYIMNLEHGYDTQIGERGVRLSGGQKQRLSIARVFLKNPSILILDEATSALDNATEILIQRALDDLCKGRTTIVVAHRLSTIRNADEILVVMDGIIKERGTHEELLLMNGEYTKLYQAQFGK